MSFGYIFLDDEEYTEEDEEETEQTPPTVGVSRLAIRDELSDEEEEIPHEVEGVSQEEVRILNGHDLLELFKSMCPDREELPLDKNGRPRRPTVGLV